MLIKVYYINNRHQDIIRKLGGTILQSDRLSGLYSDQGIPTYYHTIETNGVGIEEYRKNGMSVSKY